MNKPVRCFVAVAMMTALSLSTTAYGGKKNHYIIGTADDQFGLFPFPPWDVIDPLTGENVGLDGQFIRAIDAANERMEVELRGVNYSDCGALSDPFFLGGLLAKGKLDGCSSWAQTPRRRQAGATFAVAVQSGRFAPKGALLRSLAAPSAPSLADTDDALDAVGAVGIVGGFAADLLCLQDQYPASFNLRDKVTIGAQADIFEQLWDGTLPYAWILVTETGFPPPGTVLAHDSGAAKNSGITCGGPFALMLNEESQVRGEQSALLRLDANCGAALIAARSELWAGEDFTLADATNNSQSNTDFQEVACGEPVPTPEGGIQSFSELCALDSEIARPTLQCLEANGL